MGKRQYHHAVEDHTIISTDSGSIFALARPLSEKENSTCHTFFVTFIVRKGRRVSTLKFGVACGLSLKYVRENVYAQKSAYQANHIKTPSGTTVQASELLIYGFVDYPALTLRYQYISRYSTYKLHQK